MANARAIRRDHDPFSWLGLFGFVRWTDHCCPHCRQVYRRSYFPAAVFLGDGRRTCSSCRMAFDDESREWPELRSGQRLRFLMPPPILGFFGGVLLCGVLALLIAPRDQVTRVSAVLVLSVSLVMSGIPVLAWSAVHLPAIRRSTKRYKAVASRAGLQA